MKKSVGNIVRLREDRGQFEVTVPRAIVLSLKLKRGDELEWIVEGPDELRVRLIRKKGGGHDGGALPANNYG